MIGTGELVAPADRGLLELLASKHQFRSFIASSWSPPRDFAAANADIAAWLRASGYDLSPAG